MRRRSPPGRLGLRVIVALILSATASALPLSADFERWVLNRGQVQPPDHSSQELIPVGSLQKPFLVRAWATSHPTAAPPSFTCTRTSGCWRPSGHGTLSLRAAVRESCNTYFKSLARETPREDLEASFREAGFQWTGELMEADAIGLPGLAGVRIAPARLLPSYARLARTPWPARDDVRRELLVGMKDAAESGTASGLRLWGFLAKTGTVPALDGTPLATSGLAMVLDDTGFAFLGLLSRGTGREAAIRAGAEIAKLRPGSMVRETPATVVRGRGPITRVPLRSVDDPVRVEMLEELRLGEGRLRNLGAGPVDTARGFMGPGAAVSLVRGEWFGRSLWEIQSSKPAFERRVRAALEVEAVEGPLRMIATMTARDYANGVLKAELGPSPRGLRAQLAAAVLRYLRRGPRHPNADVCDSTHCAWFVGEGPVPRWLRPDAALNEKEMAAGLSEAEWTQARTLDRDQPGGVDLWTADCGGDPVSPHFVWGGDDRRAATCARHPRGSGRTWRREWSAAEAEAAFGARAETIDVTIVDGQWFLKVKTARSSVASGTSNTLTLTYDDAHRRLARRLGWNAMPAPASRVLRTPAGFVAFGVGFGHRVGLCLAP